MTEAVVYRNVIYGYIWFLYDNGLRHEMVKRINRLKRKAIPNFYLKITIEKN